MSGVGGNVVLHPALLAALGDALREAASEKALKPAREIAEQVRAQIERTFTGEDADLRGHIGRSHIVFGTACAYKAAERLAELDQTFELRWNAQMRAVARWRAENPGNELVLPDHADLVVWLLDQLPPAPVPA